MICINCKNEMESYFQKSSFQIVCCKNCYLMAVENKPQDLRPYYTAGYFTGDVSLGGYVDYEYEKEVTKKTYISYLDILEKYLAGSKEKSLLEVGCATGFFMELAKKRGWLVEGIDISDYAVEEAKSKGLSASVNTLELFVTDKKFDVIVMQDLIEHLPDPIGAINKAREMLSVGGLLMLLTPDAGSIWARVWGKRWHAFVPPQHLYYFSAKNLSAILNGIGLRVVYKAHHGKWFTIPYVVRLLYSWTGVAFFSKLVKWATNSFFRKVAVPINVGDTVFVLAIKDK